MFLEFFFHILKCCCVGCNLYYFAKKLATLSSHRLMLSLINMESWVLAERTFPEEGAWKYVHYYYTNKVYAHINTHGGPWPTGSVRGVVTMSFCPYHGQAGLHINLIHQPLWQSPPLQGSSHWNLTSEQKLQIFFGVNRKIIWGWGVLGIGPGVTCHDRHLC